MQLLNPGNIVTSGLQIYRSRLKSYFIISLIAHFWLIIPLLGWAKFFANAALISRLVFQEVTGNSETLQSAQKQVNQKLVGFLLSAFIVTVVVYISFNFLLIVIVIIGIRLSPFLYSSVYAYVPKSNLLQTLAFLTYVLFIVFLIGIFIASVISVYAQFFITEVILAVENNINMWNALKKSNKLISSYGFRPQLIITIASLVCLPVLLLNQIFLSLLDFGFNLLKLDNSTFLLVINVSSFLLINVILLPFWQATKALVYYDIQNRREGLTLFISRKTQE
ncbi:hypothetical protein NIES2119_30735 [[Phormidium ambiguum] IAM M-71]|uniref:Glycerophosphoryl diester phosphodiesterase membrane domain-containing protein n=1 Tax=[Phormidium ambiguum] IAM M-71 TaxID=454136 RepID=A0A1U7I389_9CYAN|nr:hypothetical protein [Phormidium ambiguum]OKH30540.1 hypothetical protein NIES2119_30735 [Phormidium ambiguum IAM M-71]